MPIHGSIKRLSPATQALVAQLTAWKTLAQRWLGGGDTLTTLERIGAACEPAAIPALMSFGLVRNHEIRSKARSVIRQLFMDVPVEALPSLDEALRTSWAHLEDWYGIKADAVCELPRDTEADRLFLALMTCHRSGYVRVEALRVSRSDDSLDLIIPFAIVRLVDWVPEVQIEAERVVRLNLIPSKAGHFVGCLGLMKRLTGNSRYSPEYSRWIEDFLRLPACALPLRNGVRATSREVRRESYRIAAESPTFTGEHLIPEAMLDTDVVVRKWAFAIGHKIGFARDVMERAAADPYAPIRRLAFDDAQNKDPISPAVLSPFLFDRSASIRGECQALFRTRLSQDPAEFYRAVIHGAPARKAEVCALGLAETGDRTDADVLVGLLRSFSARVRRAAVRALRRLGVEGTTPELLRAVESDAPSVAREAVASLLLGRVLDPLTLWETVRRNPDSAVHRSVLRQMRSAPKWQQLQIFLRAALYTELQDCAGQMTALWVRNYNRTFVQASPSDVNDLQMLMKQAADTLPGGLAREVDLILRTTGR